ncbi:GGDEF domain-containing protein [Deinococcus radiophilus]|uniref:GGDEF domain-containing protein n=1 Tax=Deinococcus radiophilus TaxID=32062 RepID=A0A431VPM9_9DEIO|nr:GGDEF domain-containing protein [Deinococcus radiophilus]RTR24711.1 GGDEF domain-containing protein [Deinococcus radiophilus]UFA51640.1 GGDEF domain-containing protein [Deinococcus radiophilus]
MEGFRVPLPLALISVAVHVYMLLIASVPPPVIYTQVVGIIGLIISLVNLYIVLTERGTIRTMGLLTVVLAALWLGRSMLVQLINGGTVPAGDLISVAVLAALAFALTPFHIAAVVSGLAFLGLCMVAGLTGGAPLPDLINLAALLITMSLISESGHRVISEIGHSEKLEYLATKDGITGLLNRVTVEQKLEERLLSPEHSGVLLLMDLDHFKQVNDQHGHQKGDQALIYAAHVLSSVAGPHDLVGRWGGEEFIMLLDGATVPEAQQRAGRIQKNLRLSPAAGLPPLSVSGGGVHTGELPGQMLSALIRRADERLYAAKNAGRCRFDWADQKREFTLPSGPQDPASTSSLCADNDL